jgi:hypothetical protein
VGLAPRTEIRLFLTNHSRILSTQLPKWIRVLLAHITDITNWVRNKVSFESVTAYRAGQVFIVDGHGWFRPTRHTQGKYAGGMGNHTMPIMTSDTRSTPDTARFFTAVRDIKSQDDAIRGPAFGHLLGVALEGAAPFRSRAQAILEEIGAPIGLTISDEQDGAWVGAHPPTAA